jgi:hypothetical protein
MNFIGTKMKLFIKSQVTGLTYVEEHTNKNSIDFLMRSGWQVLGEKEVINEVIDGPEPLVNIVEKEDVETINVIASEQPKARIRKPRATGK